MTRKIPAEEAFSFYAGLGPKRSYRAVAEKFGASKRGVTKLAHRENWAGRLASIESKTRDKADERIVDSLDEMNDRHLRIAKALQSKALRALQALPLEQAKDVIRALELGVKQERLVRGEPTERQATIEEMVKAEYDAWLVEVEADGGDRE